MIYVSDFKNWFKLKILLWKKENNKVVFKQGSWYAKIDLRGKTSWVILNQARIFDKKRLTNRLGVLDDKDMDRVKKSFLKLFSS